MVVTIVFRFNISNIYFDLRFDYGMMISDVIFCEELWLCVVTAEHTGLNTHMLEIHSCLQRRFYR